MLKRLKSRIIRANSAGITSHIAADHVWRRIEHAGWCRDGCKEMEVARANRAVPPRIILDLSSICYTDRLGAGFGHGGANPNAKEKGLCTSAYHHHYIDRSRCTPVSHGHLIPG